MTSPLTTPADPSSTVRWTPRLWGTLLVLCAAMFLDALDVSMVGVALPSIGADLGLSTSTLQWIVSGYILGYGGLLLLGGRAADLLVGARSSWWPSACSRSPHCSGASSTRARC